MIDIHCHLLPGIDDGPKSWEESVDLCRALVDDGIERAITTPHFIDGVYENGRPVTEPLIRELADRLDRAEVPLLVEAAAEIDISSRLVFADKEEIPSLCGRAMLLEMPVAVVPHAMDHILFSVCTRELVPVLAHPERNHLVQEAPDIVAIWISAGAVIQVDAESLLGIWGGAARRCAEKLLERGQVGVLASDSHSRSRRPPRLGAAVARARELIGPAAAHLVRRTPEALLSGTFETLPTLDAAAVRAPAREERPRGRLRRLLRWQ